MNFETKEKGRTWTGFVWFWKGQGVKSFYNMRRISWLAEEPTNLQEQVLVVCEPQKTHKASYYEIYTDQPTTRKMFISFLCSLEANSTLNDNTNKPSRAFHHTCYCTNTVFFFGNVQRLRLVAHFASKFSKSEVDSLLTWVFVCVIVRIKHSNANFFKYASG
jgi:hypothetical protein